MRAVLRRLAPVAFLATGACFATREDVQFLHNEMEAMRAQAARTDSVRQRQLNEVIATLGEVHDSLGYMSGRVMKMQGDIRSDLYSMGQQLLQIQELTGQSGRRLQELRASLEARGQEIQEQQAAPQGAPPGTGGAAAPSPAPGTPGPNQLFQLALDQLRRGSAGAARTALQTLLQQYPTADVAPEAQFYLGEAYRAEGNAAAADSAYAVVAQKYPESPRAPTALYKRAMYMEQQGNMTAARATLNEVIRKYPRSDEAALARDHLRSMK
jgi:tol-pal system protein YbgF